MREPMFIYALKKQVFRVLLIIDEMLLVRDNKILYSLRDRVILVHDLHLERTKGRMLFGNRAEHVAEVVVMRADVCYVVIKEHSAASGHELLYRSPLS